MAEETSPDAIQTADAPANLARPPSPGEGHQPGPNTVTDAVTDQILRCNKPCFLSWPVLPLIYFHRPPFSAQAHGDRRLLQESNNPPAQLSMPTWNQTEAPREIPDLG